MRPIFQLTFLIIGLLVSGKNNAQALNGQTEVLILGTQHLSQIENFEPSMLNKLIDKLNSYDFDAICVESMPTQLLYDINSRDDSAYVDVLKTFGGSRLKIAEKAQENYGISFLEAEEKTNDLLNVDTLSAEDQLHLTQYFLASGDVASAALQFKYLSEHGDTSAMERLTLEDRISLHRYLQSNNEIYSLAIPLAQKEGLQQIEHIDNFQDEALLLKYFPDFIKDYLDNREELENILNQPVYEKAAQLEQQGVEEKDLLSLFYFLNGEEYQEQDYKAQWEIWLQTNFSSGSDRARYALWEMRNLQIAANVLMRTAFYPKKRILVIIGASHKSFLEKYLGQVASIKLIDFE